MSQAGVGQDRRETSFFSGVLESFKKLFYPIGSIGDHSGKVWLGSSGNSKFWPFIVTGLMWNNRFYRHFHFLTDGNAPIKLTLTDAKLLGFSVERLVSHAFDPLTDGKASIKSTLTDGKPIGFSVERSVRHP